MTNRIRRMGVWLAGMAAAAAVAACGDDGAGSAARPAAEPVEGADPGDDPSGAQAGAGGGCSSSVEARPGTAITKSGAVTGTKAGGVWTWKGIPFAAPPVGDLRWRPPAPAQCWDGERAAAAFGPKCPQLKEDGKVEGDEDCLTLNVWAPESASGAPVLVFLHGGGNTMGSASDPFYDGSELAARLGAVVVTVEYRLGALGFFAHASLDAESSAKVSGNYGILDQVAALSWVKDNIAAFGGAPAKVLLFGESAGAQDTLVHVASPLSKGLFSSAIVESGGVYKTTLSEGEAQMQTVVEAAGCGAAADVPACMRGQSVQKLVAIDSAHGPLDRSKFRYSPLIDGHVLKGNAFDIISKGEHNRVPLVIGTNADETSRMAAKVATAEEYEAAVKAQYGPFADQLLTRYPASAYPSPRTALVRLTTDVTWTCPARQLARAAAQNQDAPVYRYYFTWSAPGPGGAALGATHGLELPFVFGTLETLQSLSPTAADEALSHAMQGYWSSLAASGEPTGAVAWPRYDVSTDPYIELGKAVAAKAGLATAQCDFIESIAN